MADAAAAPKLDDRFEVRSTAAGDVIVPKSEVWTAPVAAAAGGAAGGAAGKAAGGKKKKEGNRRINKSTAGRIEDSGRIGGEFAKEPNPAFLGRRSKLFDDMLATNSKMIESMPHDAIAVTLPDGSVRQGKAWETTPMDIAKSISKGLASKAIVASVKYSRRVGSGGPCVTAVDDDDEEMAKSAGSSEAELWDMNRPLEGDCALAIKTYDDPEGQLVFKHSSAHILGAAIEMRTGAKLCIGPPTKEGFYYDAYMGTDVVREEDFESINAAAEELAKTSSPFVRTVLTKDQALELFADNPFKVQLIKNKVPDNSFTSAYKCGYFVDLCMGPHVPDTSRISTFGVSKVSASYWLANANNDGLQRVYGVAFPDKKLMAQYQMRVEEARKRDHRLVGRQQELFFFHQLAPGAGFFLPHGAVIYNRLINFIREEYRARGYTEVVTPNVFNIDLWRISGHLKHYKKDMFVFSGTTPPIPGDEDDDESSDEEEKHGPEEWLGLKPMNCPGHCLMFDHRLRSYRELPIRFADFGVLHRNEASGALSGLTRVRRFQQDDAHIFCRQDQIQQEVAGVLNFLDKVYGIFGFEYKLHLSTRPEKAMGEPEQWAKAEEMMAMALNEFGRPWKINPGDGAFYGPKIDIKVYDALGREHQCATVQLDFQLPIRFGLKYLTGDEIGETARPVIIHRAILGSVERLMGILTEHTAGKWPFWLSPRQACVVPVGMGFLDYARKVQQTFHAAGFECEVSDSTKTLNKKIREAQLEQFNFILVVGAEEVATDTVNVRTRDNHVHGTKSIVDVVTWFKELAATHSKEF